MKTNGSGLAMKDLASQIEELKHREPTLQDDDLFVLWFLRAYVTDNEQLARQAVAGGSGDKSIDAVYVDSAARGVFIVQGKYRRHLQAKPESRSDVLAFAQLAHCVSEPDEAKFRQFTEKMDDYTAELLRTARKHVLKEGYRVWLYFVTLGKCSPTVQADANGVVRSAKCDATVEVFDGRRLMLVLRDYLDGVAPPIPTLDLEMEQGAAVVVNQIMQRYDPDSQIESWVFPMRGDSIAALYELAGLRLFARNIRGFLGETPVNRGMAKTIKTEPARFFYYNNGITILCDKAEKRSSKGRDVLRVSNPQVINGQQTTRTLAAHAKEAARASVLVKVMQVPRDVESGIDGFDDLLSRIVAGTNWQNAIRPSDLMSNDRQQIELERALRKIRYIYLRKRQTKGDAKRSMGGKGYIAIKSGELAQAVAGCDLDPHIVRSGKENLFEEDLYPRVFPNSDPNYYLPRYWLSKAVTYGAKGKPQRGYAKWLVLNLAWSQLSPLLRSRKNAEAFRTMAERNCTALWWPLNAAVDRVFIAAVRFYNSNKGTGESSLDISSFFRNTTGRHKQFEVMWNSRANTSRGIFEKSLREIAEAITTFEG